eukprot:946719_1
MTTDFDVDKHLMEFADALRKAGCSIKDIGTALQNQPEALKDKNWNAVAKKAELSNFVEIYTVILSVIAYALKSKQISYKPSQSCIKALTIKVTKKLPQENDKPLLTQFEYVNNLHNILYDIHEQIDPGSTSTDQDSFILIADIETQQRPTTAYVCKTWQVGTRCKATNFQRDGKDYDGKTCRVSELYNADFGGYFVRFDDDNVETYVAAHRLECISMGSGMDEAGEMDALHWDDHSDSELSVVPLGERTTTRSNSGLNIDLPDFNCIDVDCIDISDLKYRARECASDFKYRARECASDLKYRARKCASDPMDWIGERIQEIPACICFLVLVALAAATIHGGRMKVKDGEEYENLSTEEMCLILSYERNKCEFECGTNGCSNYKSKYGDNV